MSKHQRTAVVGGGIVQIGLLAAALTDLRRRPADRINGSKPLWTALSFVNVIGPLAYFAVGRKR